MNKKMRELMEKIKAKRDLADKLLEEKNLKEADEVFKECKELQKEFEEEKERFEKEKANVNFNKSSDGRIIKDAVLPNEKLSKNKSYDKEEKDLRLSEIIKGMYGKRSNSREREYISKVMSASGSIVVPEDMADRIMDVAREKSALFGKIPTIQMDNNNLTIISQTRDAEAHFVDENQPIPESEALFGATKLEGKTLAVLIPVSEKLLDSCNIEEVLIASVTKAIANELDKALLYGRGIPTKEQKTAGQPDEIAGLFTRDDVNKVNVTVPNGEEPNWDFVVAATKSIRKSNIEATDVVYNTDLADRLAVLKDKDGCYINKPEFCNRYAFTESNNIKDNNAVAYDMQSLLLGINKGITLDLGYTAGQFERLQRAIRVHLRVDLGVVNPKGVSVVTFNEA